MIDLVRDVCDIVKNILNFTKFTLTIPGKFLCFAGYLFWSADLVGINSVSDAYLCFIGDLQGFYGDIYKSYKENDNDYKG